MPNDDTVMAAALRQAPDDVVSAGKPGLWMCTALVVGNMIGCGIFLLPAALAAFGPISIAGWLVTSTGAIVLALIFGRLARLVPKTGGPYTYSREGFGDFAGYIGFLIPAIGEPVYVWLKWRNHTSDLGTSVNQGDAT